MRTYSYTYMGLYYSWHSTQGAKRKYIVLWLARRETYLHSCIWLLSAYWFTEWIQDRMQRQLHVWLSITVCIYTVCMIVTDCRRLNYQISALCNDLRSAYIHRSDRCTWDRPLWQIRESRSCSRVKWNAYLWNVTFYIYVCIDKKPFYGRQGRNLDLSSLCIALRRFLPLDHDPSSHSCPRFSPGRNLLPALNLGVRDDLKSDHAVVVWGRNRSRQTCIIWAIRP